MLSPELLMVAATSRGLLISDFEEMTIGMILDYVIFYDEQHRDKKDEPKEATQADIDAFFG